MRTLSFRTRMIELASEINAEMPAFVVRKVAAALNRDHKPVNASRVLVVGVAYKKDIDDMRESPAFDVMRLLQDQGAEIAYHDPHCPVIDDDGHTAVEGLPLFSQPLDAATLRRADCVVILTDHYVRGLPRHRGPRRGWWWTPAGRCGHQWGCRVIGLSGSVEQGAPPAHRRLTVSA
jgi:UDP-N-acetyl-D-mannosaminuronate dehydrogenase